MNLKFQSSIGSKLFEKVENSIFFSKFSKIVKIEEESENKRGREDACSTSYPSGNQVDGLPLVAIARKSNTVAAGS